MLEKQLLEKARELSDRLVKLQTPIRILDAISWPRATREEFFQHKGQRLPNITADYYINRVPGFDTVALRQALAELERDIVRNLGQLSPISQLMKRACREYRDVIRMIEARGTEEFHELSVELYGHPDDVFHAGEPTLAELAQMLSSPLASLLASDALPEEAKNLDAAVAVERLQQQLNVSMPGLSVEVMLSDGIISDAAAGSDRIKMNQDVKFSQRELDILEVHEGWIHVGTTQNGLAQPYLTCLSKGTPSATITQEGLAVLTEIITMRSTPRRLAKLVGRIDAVKQAADGADFIEVYRSGVAKGMSTDEAYTLTQRVFRGSTPNGSPFTKDLAYIKGFVLVYNLIRVAIQIGRIDRLPLLLTGKIAVDDFRQICELHDSGVIEAPRFVPPHFKDMRGLAAWLSVGRFLGDFSFTQLENDYKPLIP
ncbi:flavohemoglobin expression-modulating QEGLA motif protein [Aliidiomarina quisquiliarum]|uniref:flavohemoglobin expression-modulating QEGLA motif protein n=1 Tax=Aliidiomarina quisquiliarum TaxID=2938947 RepID=UPI00208EC04D|nr:flavohemoglobin expression-modulating QEGLA motif protein [Aliidiomarina quisquiliarum]MCO4322015.1 flavohemoglobin expression-modulating QEGLA motif protein [Aliidiomarina quisquiliarum]